MSEVVEVKVVAGVAGEVGVPKAAGVAELVGVVAGVAELVGVVAGVAEVARAAGVAIFAKISEI